MTGEIKTFVDLVEAINHYTEALIKLGNIVEGLININEELEGRIITLENGMMPIDLTGREPS